MSDNIRVVGNQIRTIGQEIGSLDCNAIEFSEDQLSDTDGLTSSRMKSLMSELTKTMELTKVIIENSPRKLSDIADAFETSDSKAATGLS